MNGRPQRWLLVAVLWVVALLNYLDRQVIFSLFPLLERDLGATSVQLGLLSTVFLWVYGILSPFAGYLADRFGRVRVILFSLAVWSAVTWATAHVHSIGGLLATRALMGISEACYLPAALALIVESHGLRSRSLATGIHQSGLYTGVILGGAWGGWMGDHYGWRPVFLMLGAAGLVYAAVVLLVLRPLWNAQSTADQRPHFVATVSLLWSIPAVRQIGAAFTIFGLAGWVVYTWLPIYLYERFGMSLTEAGFTSTFYIQAASYAGIFAGGWIADRYIALTARARVLTQAAGLLISAPFLALIGWTATHVILILALVTFGFGRGLYDANNMPALSQFAPAEIRATGYGLLNLASCVVGGIGAAAAGSLKQVVGLSAAFQISAALMVVAAVFLIRVRPVHAVLESEQAAEVRR